MGVLRVVRRVGGVARERNITFLAASVAYYAFVSLVPLLLLVLVVGNLVGGESFARLLVRRVESLLSSSGQDVLRTALTNSQGRTGAGVVGLLTLTWSALRLFRGLDLAFAEAYGTASDPSLVKQVLDGVVTIVLLALTVGLMVAVGYVVRLPAVAEALPVPNVVGTLALFVGLVVAFLPLYYVLPPVDVSVREALPGALFAGVGWLVLQVGFRIYAANAAEYQAYGILGAVLLLVTWLYFAGVFFLLGAAVNAVLAGRSYGAG